jgi:K+-transporting ATPase A subunit
MPRGVWLLILPLFNIILLYILVPLFQQNILKLIYGGKIQFHLLWETGISFMAGKRTHIYGGNTDVYLWREN